MKLKVRMIIGDKRIEPSELPGIIISNPSIDRIVNHVVDRVVPKKKKASQQNNLHVNSKTGSPL